MLSVFIEGQELATLQPQNFPFTEEESAVLSAFASFGQAPDPDADPTDRPSFSPSRRIFTDVEIAADVIASQDPAQHGESAQTVEKKWERTETLTPSVAFDRAHFLLEPRSKNSFMVCRYVADVWLACKYVLRSDLKLWFLYRRLFEEGQHTRIPAHVLARSKDVQEIKYLCGTEILRRRLHSFTLYGASVRHRRGSHRTGHKKPAIAGG